MVPLPLIAARSAWNRRTTLSLVVLSIALSVALLLGVERLRHDARDGFAHSVSGTDLIVGARTAPVQLLLNAVFRIGSASAGMRWQSFADLSAMPQVAWAVPLSLGDSHRGFPVLGTTPDYFDRVRHGRGTPLRFVAGQRFAHLFDAVLGAEVAERLGYRVGQTISLEHGSGAGIVAAHDDKPFTVTGILARTGTPIDRTVHVGLEAIEAIHLDWQGGAPVPGLSIPADMVRKFDLTPKTITAAMVGLHSRAAVFRVQRSVNAYPGEALIAILPGVALDELWSVVAVAETTLLAISTMVVVVGLAGLVAVILAGLNERRRELAVLRAVGASPRQVFALLTIEGLMVTAGGLLLGLALLVAASAAAAPLVQARLGIDLALRGLSTGELGWLAVVAGASLLACLIPGYRAYRLSLADGLTPRL
ncbi:MAG TPA: FtsX-like permease family protein [Quisquiliibacterium sp.]|nr:FtsX-like permease family protein [Quisquiliibacterium sp.]